MSQKPVAILGAMDCEVDLLLKELTNHNQTTHYGYLFHTGKIENQDVVVVKCGIGKVNAARGTQMLIDLYQPSLLINTGVAGGLGKGQKVGDVVVASVLYQHDFDLSPLGYVPGSIPELGEKTKPTGFLPDQAAAKAIAACARKILKDNTVWEAPVVSGDIFVASNELKTKLYENFQASAAEMEGAAIAQVARIAGVPFAIVRALSDLADGSASISFAEFEVLYGHLSSQIVLDFLKNLN